MTPRHLHIESSASDPQLTTQHETHGEVVSDWEQDSWFSTWTGAVLKFDHKMLFLSIAPLTGDSPIGNVISVFQSVGNL